MVNHRPTALYRRQVRGEGSIDLAKAVISACDDAKADTINTFNFLYPLEISLKDKIEKICKEIYGADGVEYSELAEQRLSLSKFYCFGI
jgi:formyltetrahydrofolate synthetase